MNNTVVYSTNFDNIDFLEYSLKSLIKFNSNIDIYILTDKVCVNDIVITRLSPFNVKYIFCDLLFELYFTNSKTWYVNVTKYAYYRLLIPFIIEFLSCSNIVYLDPDTVILGNIQELFDTNFTTDIAMCYEKIHCVDIYKLFKHRFIMTIKVLLTLDANLSNIIKMPKYYYNSGVIVFNMQSIKKHIDNWQQYIKYYNLYYDNNLFFAEDLTFLNIFFDITCLGTDNEYNSMNVASNTKICHYYSGSRTQYKYNKFLTIKNKTINLIS